MWEQCIKYFEFFSGRSWTETFFIGLNRTCFNLKLSGRSWPNYTFNFFLINFKYIYAWRNVSINWSVLVQNIPNDYKTNYIKQAETVIHSHAFAFVVRFAFKIWAMRQGVTSYCKKFVIVYYSYLMYFASAHLLLTSWFCSKNNKYLSRNRLKTL